MHMLHIINYFQTNSIYLTPIPNRHVFFLRRFSSFILEDHPGGSESHFSSYLLSGKIILEVPDHVSMNYCLIYSIATLYCFLLKVFRLLIYFFFSTCRVFRTDTPFVGRLIFSPWSVRGLERGLVRRILVNIVKMLLKKDTKK